MEAFTSAAIIDKDKNRSIESHYWPTSEKVSPNPASNAIAILYVNNRIVKPEDNTFTEGSINKYLQRIFTATQPAKSRHRCAQCNASLFCRTQRNETSGSTQRDAMSLQCDTILFGSAHCDTTLFDSTQFDVDVSCISSIQYDVISFSNIQYDTISLGNMLCNEWTICSFYARLQRDDDKDSIVVTNDIQSSRSSSGSSSGSSSRSSSSDVSLSGSALCDVPNSCSALCDVSFSGFAQCNSPSQPQSLFDNVLYDAAFSECNNNRCDATFAQAQGNNLTSNFTIQSLANEEALGQEFKSYLTVNEGDPGMQILPPSEHYFNYKEASARTTNASASDTKSSLFSVAIIICTFRRFLPGHVNRSILPAGITHLLFKSTSNRNRCLYTFNYNKMQIYAHNEAQHILSSQQEKLENAQVSANTSPSSVPGYSYLRSIFRGSYIRLQCTRECENIQLADFSTFVFIFL